MYTVASVNFPNALPMQRLDDLRVTHQAQVSRRSLSYEAVLFYYTNITRETFHSTKSFPVVWEEGTAEVLFDKKPAPPPP